MWCKLAVVLLFCQVNAASSSSTSGPSGFSWSYCRCCNSMDCNVPLLINLSCWPKQVSQHLFDEFLWIRGINSCWSHCLNLETSCFELMFMIKTAYLVLKWFGCDSKALPHLTFRDLWRFSPLPFFCRLYVDMFRFLWKIGQLLVRLPSYVVWILTLTSEKLLNLLVHSFFMKQYRPSDVFLFQKIRILLVRLYQLSWWN